MKESLPPFTKVYQTCPHKQLCTDKTACVDAMLLIGDIDDADRRVMSPEVVLMLQNRIGTFTCGHKQAEAAREAAQKVINDFYNDRDGGTADKSKQK